MQPERALGTAQKIIDAAMLLWDVVEVFGRVGDKPAQTKARLRPEGRTRALSQLREWSLCVAEQALSSWLPNPLIASYLDLPYSTFI
ncbi:hypothetical protein PBY51_009351 [Eleginops maclovinus]|uniref:Uncharacterized protein n=1 Tax=Eleginops maclovinus TaxID=56733 RepID=A0AAN7XXA2_ELEMC|nr:hypothetical protein PBY51_009351 [Eleginops maclovinus]